MKRLSLLLLLLCATVARADDDVLLQGFYWNCPQDWWVQLKGEVAELKRAGFSAVWLPPPQKGAGGREAMGYDVFDHYDLGEYDQKGTVPTRFGTKAQLKELVAAFHAEKIEVYADLVLNHMTGGQLVDNPLKGTQTWSRFSYPHGRFEKSWRDFHPCPQHPDEDAPYHSNVFGEDLCHANPRVRDGLIEWGDWLTREVGFDGYRLDFVNAIEPTFLKAFLNAKSMRGKFAVGELWHGDKRVLAQWVEDTGASVFDFNLFYRLQGMCNAQGSFDMRQLASEGYFRVNPFKAVTFVENHDTARKEPVIHDKLLAYAFILTMEGRPCVYYEDYAVHGLKPQIDPLIAVRRELAGGSSSVLHADEDLLVIQRNGHEDRPGLILVLNDGQQARSAWVTCKWPDAVLLDRVGGQPQQRTHADGRVQLGAPARGYAVYAPRVAKPQAASPGGISGALGQ